MYDVFISYSSTDQKVVEALSHYLEERGVRCFVAYRDIPPGTVWAGAITKAIENCRLMVVVFSKDFNISVQVDREIELCAEEKKPILTYRIQNEAFIGVKKYYLKNLNWIDAFPNPAECFQSLYESITKLLKTELMKISFESKTLIEENKLQKERENLEQLKAQLDGEELRQELIIIKAEKERIQQELNNSRVEKKTIKKDDNLNLQINSVIELLKDKVDTSSKSRNITETVNGVSFDMVFVKGGTFLMGSPENDPDRSNSETQHKVTLRNFYIAQILLTQSLWEAVNGNNPSYFKGKNNPVECVSWYDAVEFCNKLSRLKGLQPAYSITGHNVTLNGEAMGFRLPTEAEWEFAARGGNQSKGYMYAGSNDLDKVAWYDENSEDKTHSVAQKQPNELGLYDMSGNLSEWCWDWWRIYSVVSQTNPVGPTAGLSRVNRGGGWCADSESCRINSRYLSIPEDNNCALGFRLVLPK